MKIFHGNISEQKLASPLNKTDFHKNAALQFLFHPSFTAQQLYTKILIMLFTNNFDNLQAIVAKKLWHI